MRERKKKKHIVRSRMGWMRTRQMMRMEENYAPPFPERTIMIFLTAFNLRETGVSTLAAVSIVIVFLEWG